MALVLREKQNRKGETTRFDVVRAEEGSPSEILSGIEAGEYRILSGASIGRVNVSYRTVQDIDYL
jgi:hypothetical protein